MYPYIHIILPAYGVFAFLGGFFALIFVYCRTSRFEIDFLDFLKLFVLCVFGCAIGSKVLFILSRISWLFRNLTPANLVNLVFHSGYVFYGGLLGVLLTVQLYARRSERYTAKQLYALMTPAIPLFHCFGRIGCLMAGCCFGLELSVPITIYGLTLTRFPTQLLESLFEMGLFFLLLILERHISTHPLLPVYLITYACFRFVVEFFRGDEIRGVLLGLSISQWISIAVLLFYIRKAVAPSFSIVTSKKNL